MNHQRNTVSAQRRALSRLARDAFPPMGVYAIRDRGTPRVWVGSSRNVDATLGRIQFELARGAHPDTNMQAAWRANPANLAFEVLERVTQRTDPSFDYAAELKLLEQLHRHELCHEVTR